jgi:general secretion pathway protein I
MRASARGFTLVEVLVALVVVALGLAALMVAVQGAARTSGYLRDKTLAQWIGLNRIAEVRLTTNKSSGVSSISVTSTLSNSSSNFSSSSSPQDKGELQFAGRTWHYDTRYFDTTFPSMKRIVVRVWAGDAKTKGNPIAEVTSFYGTSLGQPGVSNTPWDVGSTVSTALPCNAQAGGIGTSPSGLAGGSSAVAGQPGVNCTPASGIPSVAPTTGPAVQTQPPGQSTQP